MSWLKDVYQARKAKLDEDRALRETTEATYDKHDPMVRRLLHDAADLLWGPSGVFPAGTNVEINGIRERSSWSIKYSADVFVVNLDMNYWYNTLQPPCFLVEYKRHDSTEEQARTKDLTEEELKNALKRVLKERVTGRLRNFAK